MIIDSHLYCFKPADAPAGHSSGEEHIRWVQASHAYHQQPAWRIRDRKPAPSDNIAPEGHADLSRLPDVDFRVDREKGRLVWTIDGEDYTKQYFPPNLRNCEFTPHSAIAEMDYAGIDMALLHTDPMLGKESVYQAECVNLYPDRLLSMIPVDEWRIKPEPDKVIEELVAAVKKHGLHAVKFNPPLAYLSGPEPWDDGAYRPFWETASTLGVPVFFTLGSGPREIVRQLSKEGAKQGYLDELKILIRWMERYPEVLASLTHGFPWRLFLEGNRIELPDEIWNPFRNPNCHIEVSFPVRLGDLFDYPYPEVRPALEAMIAHAGADHLLWGTDMPFQNRFCTYRQSRDYIEKYCRFLSKEELSMLMGGTAARILGLRKE